MPSRRSLDNSSRNAAHPAHDPPLGSAAAPPRGNDPSKRAISNPTVMPPVYTNPPDVSSLPHHTVITRLPNAYRGSWDTVEFNTLIRNAISWGVA